MRRWHAIAMLLTAAGLSAVGRAQESSVAAGVPLRVIVTDARGRHVPGITAADLDVSEAGRPQTIRSVVGGNPTPRRIGILLDDYHVSAGPATARTVAALLDFVNQQLRADDVVFVTRPLDPASGIAPVHDLTALRSIVSTFEGRKGDYTARNEFESEYLSSVPPAAARQRAQIVRAAMQALATAMGRSPAPASMIVVTEGFAAEDRGRERLSTLRTVARAARLASVGVYVINPSIEPDAASAFTDQWQLLSSQTGGVLTPAGPSMSDALSKVSTDLDASYLLTIDSPEKEDGAFHRLDVTTKRKNVTLRAPSGYWAPIAAERITPPLRPAMSTYLKTPHSSGLIQPWFRMSKVSRGRIRVAFSWAPRRGGGAAVAFSALTFEGKPLLEQRVDPQGTIGGTQAVFEAPPGPIQVTMAISDRAGKLLDTDVRYIDVPPFDGAGATIAGIEVVRTRTLREFLERQLQPDILPADTTEFDRHDRLIVRVRAFTQTGEAPRISARLLNPLGQPMRDLTPLPEIDGIPQFDLPLASYARGDYRIEITATAGKSSTAQLVMFRLIG